MNSRIRDNNTLNKKGDMNDKDNRQSNEGIM